MDRLLGTSIPIKVEKFLVISCQYDKGILPHAQLRYLSKLLKIEILTLPISFLF